MRRRADFAPVTCGYGEMFRFRGNECEHFTELNLTSATRVSMDFRVIRSHELPMKPVLDTGVAGGRGASEYFTLGRYYARVHPKAQGDAA